MYWLKELGRVGLIWILAIVGLSAVATLCLFPWDVDPSVDRSNAAAKFYTDRYSTGAASKGAQTLAAFPPVSEKEQFYIDFARNAAAANRVPEQLADFVRHYNLLSKHVLEVGAGSGLLQDVVEDYTALDISPTAARFFHKPFVAASATDMPFPSDSFDGLWSVWVLEHISNPEKALLEMRRVLKPGGYMFLMPALDVSRYAAAGYHARPYSDFNWAGKTGKFSAAVIESPAAAALLYWRQIRLLRSLVVRAAVGPSRLHFVALRPNYDQYWETDSDATTSVSRHELYLWFMTRGDSCLNCVSDWKQALGAESDSPMIIRVNKAR